MNEQPKVFCGNAKMFTFKGDQTGVEIKVTLNELTTMLEAAKERGWMREYPARGETQREVTLKAWPMREPTKYATHYLELTEPYRKTEETTGGGERKAARYAEDEDLPF